MRRLLPLLVVLAVLALAVAFLLRSRPGKERGLEGFAFHALYDEACAPVSPEALGGSWPEDAAIEAMRAAWSALGVRDSTIFDELMRDWLYPNNELPLRLTNVAQTPAGKDLPLEQRLALGETLLEHPGWRVGSARHFPALSVVLTSTEKCVLSSLLHAGEGGMNVPMLVRDLALPRAELEPVIAGLARLGWVDEVPGAGDTYRLTRDDLRAGALQFLTYVPQYGRSLDLVSAPAALRRMSEPIRRGRVTLTGPCVETGKRIVVDLVDGRLRRGRPGSVWVGGAETPGLTNGLFSSKHALSEWREEHPGVTMNTEGPFVQVYRKLVNDAP